jgi:hypothetical protein
VDRRRKRILRKDELLVSSPDQALRVHMTSQCRHLAVRMPVALCTEYLSRELHIPVNRPLTFYTGKQGGCECPRSGAGCSNISARN